VDYSVRQAPGRIGKLFERLDNLQDMARPAARSEEAAGYWIFLDHESIAEGLRQSDLWSSGVIDATEPNPDYKWIPIMLDAPEHTKWRRLFSAWFTPKRAKAMKEDQHRLAREIVEKLRDKGECEYVSEFAQILPAMVFLRIMGMPLDKLDQFIEWEHMILHQDERSDPDRATQTAGLQAVSAYFASLIAERRANPNPDADDIVSAATTWEIDGEPAPDSDIVNCLLTLFMAGLDTVAGSISYFTYHLATHPQDRARIVAEPQLIPHAVDELLRMHAIVQPARRASRDAEFNGCPVKAGDVAHFPISAAGRDEIAYPDARRVDFDRGPINHLSFGAGPHRCPGSNLALQELAVMLEEWHRAIPDYEVIEEPLEHGSKAVLGPAAIRLRWDL
jgi:cytochrome P450